METRIRIALIGNSEKKEIFLTDIIGEEYLLIEPMFRNQFLVQDKFFIDTLYGHDLGDRISYPSVKRMLEKIDVIIYLSPSICQKAEVENIRRQYDYKILAVDFNKLNLTPKKCLASIEKLYYDIHHERVIIQQNGLINKAEIINKHEVLHKHMLVNQFCLFNFPKELSRYINLYLISLAEYSLAVKQPILTILNDQEQEQENLVQQQVRPRRMVCNIF